MFSHKNFHCVSMSANKLNKRFRFRLLNNPRRFPAALICRRSNKPAFGKQKQALSCCDAPDRRRQTFTLSSFLKDENSVSEWPEARGHHEEPLSHCPRRGCARRRQHTGGHEQRLQEQPTYVVRSDVHRTAPHKNWAQLSSGNFTHLLNRMPSLISIKLQPRGRRHQSDAKN